MVLPNVDDVSKVADQLRKMPEVDKVTTIAELRAGRSGAQARDRSAALARQLQTPLEHGDTARPPTDAQNRRGAEGLRRRADASWPRKASGPGADAANRLAASLTKLADADPDKRDAADAAFVVPLRDRARRAARLSAAGPVTSKTCPTRLKRPMDRRRWPRAGPGDAEGRSQRQRNAAPFRRAIQAQFPDAVGTPISILESGKTIVRAFIHAGIFALLSIAILLWIVLRRFGDVLLTLMPLLLAGLVTLEICVLIGMPLNFANIIALPLLLGVGVAFKIYYIMAWRAGQTNLLQSSLTRAVILSALTTATAFGSLWLSSHPGTSSMGKLLALSLVQHDVRGGAVSAGADGQAPDRRRKRLVTGSQARRLLTTARRPRRRTRTKHLRCYAAPPGFAGSGQASTLCHAFAIDAGLASKSAIRRRLDAVAAQGRLNMRIISNRMLSTIGADLVG